MRRVDDEPGILVRAALFLTSKVRLHCDIAKFVHHTVHDDLFLTSKVRLHCDQINARHINLRWIIFS